MKPPVLLIAFNRPHETEKVLAAISNYAPERVYIAIDGPRNPKEAETVSSVRRIADSVEKCRVFTKYSGQNQGCRIAVSSAINWFFEQEERGIILEDDCLPHPDFFSFCERMLEMYSGTDQVKMISGSNYLFGNPPSGRDFFFSRYFAIWGWASWRRAWKEYDITMKNWPSMRKDGTLKKLYRRRDAAFLMRNYLDAVYAGTLDTWDLQWVYSCLLHGGFTLTPAANLVANIGVSGTRSSADENIFLNMPFQRQNLNAGFRSVEYDADFDAATFRTVISHIPGWKFRLRRMLRLWI